MRYLNKLFAWMGSDGMSHLILSAIIAVFLSLFLPLELAAMITLAVGIGNELYDRISGKGCSEWKDIVCDIVGILIGVL